MRVFLDANILYSAAKADGAIRRLLAMLLAAGHECWADLYVAEEARRNLARTGPEALVALESLLGRIRMTARLASGAYPAADVALADRDRPVLAAAIHIGCDALLTGDRTHFGALYGTTVRGVVVHSPQSLAEALLSG